MTPELPIVAKLMRQYSSTSPANADGPEAATLIKELYAALVRLGTLTAAKYGNKDDEVWAAVTQGIIACAKARGEVA